MQFGLFNLMSVRSAERGVPGAIADMRDMVRLAEAIGFDTAWFAEHHFTNYSVSVSPLMMTAHMAGQTNRIRLGAAVVVLPLYHPMRVAQEIALADQLSSGRLVLGVGTGYQAYEFDRYNMKVSEKTDVFLEYWSVVEQALTTGHARFSGRYVNIPETVFLLRPVQQPMPDLFVTSMDPRILQRLAPYRAVPFLTAGWRGSAALAGMADHARKAWSDAGLVGQAPVAVQQYIHVTDDPKQALKAAECARFVGRMATALRHPDLDLKDAFIEAPPLPDEPGLEVFRDNVIIGDAHHVAERIVAEIRRIDPVHYNCFFQFGEMPIAMARRSLERFGREVMPLLDKTLGSLGGPGLDAAPTQRLAALA